ncbi:MAG: PIN domain-containing protein [Mycobacteriales bacterium]
MDTSILVGFEQRRLIQEQVPSHAGISVLTLEELWLGVLTAEPQALADRRATYDVAARSLPALPVDGPVALACGDIRADGRRRGVRYAPVDSLIAATARVHGLPLYTQDAGMAGMIGVDVRVV